jgi:glycosyltransferase involved in cell wall biosynthesis
MRIGYVSNVYPAISNTFILREVMALREAGVDVQTVSIRTAPPEHLLSELDRRAAAETVTVLPAKPSQLVRAHARAFIKRPGRYLRTLQLALRLSPAGLRGRVWQVFYFLEAMVVWDTFERRGIRHLHAHFANVACDVVLLASHYGDRAGGERWSFSFTVHGPGEFYELAQNRLKEKARRAAMVVCISHFARSQVMGLVEEDEWDKLSIVHCGVDPAAFTAPEREPDPSRPIRILNVGRLVPVKGQAVLLEALSRLIRRGVDADLVIIGDGPDRPALEAVVRRLGLQDRVTLAGAIGQDEIRDFYRAADIFCMSSFAEGLPVVLMEAMAMELAVVSTQIMGIPELVEHEANGLLLLPADPAGLADALERLVTDRDLRHELARRGREKVVRDFDSASSARQLAELYRTMPGVDGRVINDPERDLVPAAAGHARG